MKILDATAVIAFLSEMECPETLQELSKYYQLIIPEGVVIEIRRSPGKEMLKELIKKKNIQIVKVDHNRTIQMQKEHPQLHSGECEVMTLAMSHADSKQISVVSDDLKVRKIFQNFNFSWTEQLLDVMKDKGMLEPNTYESKMNRLSKSPFYSRSKKRS